MFDDDRLIEPAPAPEPDVPHGRLIGDPARDPVLPAEAFRPLEEAPLQLPQDKIDNRKPRRVRRWYDRDGGRGLLDFRF